MEAEFEQKMQELRQQHVVEKNKKAALDIELSKVRDELDNIEVGFPQECRDLKEQIEFAKQQTMEYERKTKDLQGELNELKAQRK